MAKRIIDIVREKQEQFKTNKVLAGQNMAMGIAALREGIKSNAWQYYMSQFVDRSTGTLDKNQLARLMATDETLGDPVYDRQRAYLVANSVCGVSTADVFHVGVETIDLDPAACAALKFGCETGMASAPKPKMGQKKKAAKNAKKKG